MPTNLDGRKVPDLTDRGELSYHVMPRRSRDERSGGGTHNYFIEVDGVPDDDHAAIRALCAKYDVDILE